MSQRSAALAMLLLASTMNAAFALPMGWIKRWSWQSTWLVWSVFALLVLPNVFAVTMASHPYALFAAVAAGLLLRVVLFGAGWGVAQVLFGLAIRSVGVAIAFALVLGMSACAGGLLPVAMSPGSAFPPALLAGVTVMLAGLAMCAYAGSTRDAAGLASPAVEATAGTGKAWKGVLLAILAGVCASCMNLGLLAARPLLQVAQDANVTPYVAANLLWVPLLAGGAVPNVLYCLWLAHAQETLPEFRMPGTAVYALLAFTMAVLWFGSNLAYGVALHWMGALGPEWGWPAYMSLIVVLAGVFGFVRGEWKGSTMQCRTWQGAGMTMLVFGVFLMSRNHG